MLPRLAPVIASLALLAAGCGGGESEQADPVEAVQPSARDAVRAAQTVDPSAFPDPAGKTLEDIAAEFDTGGPQAIVAASVFRPSETQRLPFALLDASQKFSYGKTVVYVQRRGAAAAQGPFAAPADVLLTQPRYRSQQAATDDDPFAAIYDARVPIDKPGVWNALAVSDIGGARIAAPMSFQVGPAAKDAIPDIGEQAPRVHTDTLGSVKGNEDLLNTRIPPALELNKTDLADALGKRPVALLFATPQLCQSRVCGPVVDEMLQLKARYGDRVTFIHQEVYVDNDPNKGLREPLQRFNLPTEPWLFTFDAEGRVAARLEGSFGLGGFERAVKAAL